MQTECPHCHTVFRLSEQDLEQADGQVRCGHCLAIFTADNPYESHHNIEVTASREQDNLDLEQLEPVINDDRAEIVLPDVIPPELRAETRSRKHGYSMFGSVLWSLAILAMIATGMLQYAYYDRLRLVQYDELRPWLGLLCKYARCDLPEPRDPRRIELSSKNIYTHPNANDALMVSATMVNQAEYPQDFPIVELRFEDMRGQTIAARRFKPDEYLGIPEDKIKKMEPGDPISFNLEIVDPGKDVMSYEFRFL